MLFRGLVWLIALCALVLPSAVAPAVAMTPVGHAMMSDCPHHHPVPAQVPGPEKDTAHHVGDCCCPLMAHGGALLPAATSAANFLSIDAPASPLARQLTGLSPHTDPPPPRA